MTNVMLIAILGKVFAYCTRDPCRVSISRLAKRGSQICKLVYPAAANCCTASIIGAYEHRQTSEMQGPDLQLCSPRRCQTLLACRRSSAAGCRRRMHAASKRRWRRRRQSEPAGLVWWRTGS